MERLKWMYRLKRMELKYVVEVKTFLVIVKKHQKGLSQMTTIYLYAHCKNTKSHEDAVMLSHLIKFGFVKDYTVWTFHDESASVASSSSGRGNSSTTMNAGGPPADITVDGN